MFIILIMIMISQEYKYVKLTKLDILNMYILLVVNFISGQE